MGWDDFGAMRQLPHLVHAGGRSCCKFTGPVAGPLLDGRTGAVLLAGRATTRPRVHGQQFGRVCYTIRHVIGNYFFVRGLTLPAPLANILSLVGWADRTILETDVMSNYTPKMIEQIKAAAPLNIEKARALAADFGLSHRSVISKAKHLDVEYTPAVRKAASKAAGPTKAETLAAIRKALSLPERSGDFTKAELAVIAENIG